MAKQLPKPEALPSFVEEPGLFLASLWSCQGLTLECWLLLEEAIWNLKRKPVGKQQNLSWFWHTFHEPHHWNILKCELLLLANLKTTICLSGKGIRRRDLLQSFEPKHVSKCFNYEARETCRTAAKRLPPTWTAGHHAPQLMVRIRTANNCKLRQQLTIMIHADQWLSW